MNIGDLLCLEQTRNQTYSQGYRGFESLPPHTLILLTLNSLVSIMVSINVDFDVFEVPPCQEFRPLMGEMQEIGCKGCFSCLAGFLAPWRKRPRTPVAFETTIPTASITPLQLAANSLFRSISPQIAAALLGKLQPKMTIEQEKIVDALIKVCPGYAVMRSLVMGFRTILRTGKIETLHDWMKRATDSGINGMQRFVRTLKQNPSAAEAAVEQTWSNGHVEGHINKLKTIKRQMYGRAGFELLRARILPLPPSPSLHQE